MRGADAIQREGAHGLPLAIEANEVGALLGHPHTGRLDGALLVADDEADTIYRIAYLK